MISYEVSSGPSSEPLTRSEVATFLKLDDDNSENDLIDALIVAARQYCEYYTDTKLFTQTVKAYMDEFPEEEIKLLYPPFQSVTSVEYYDADNSLQTLSSSLYTVNTKGTKLSIKSTTTFPESYDRKNAVIVTFVSGYSSVDSIPENLKMAMKLMISNWHLNREDHVKKLPTASEHLMNAYKVYY